MLRTVPSAGLSCACALGYLLPVGLTYLLPGGWLIYSLCTALITTVLFIFTLPLSLSTVHFFFLPFPILFITIVLSPGSSLPPVHPFDHLELPFSWLFLVQATGQGFVNKVDAALPLWIGLACLMFLGCRKDWFAALNVWAKPYYYAVHLCSLVMHAWLVLAFGWDEMRIILDVGLCWLLHIRTNGASFRYIQ